MGEVHVRRAGHVDVPALARLRRAWAEEQAGGPVEDPVFEAAFEDWFGREEDHRVIWLALHGGEPVGMLNMLVFTRMPKPARHRSQWGYVANVYVDPARRDAGIGGRLLDAAVAHARQSCFARLVLSPSRRSVPFYRRAGFGPATALLVHELGG